MHFFHVIQRMGPHEKKTWVVSLQSLDQHFGYYQTVGSNKSIFARTGVSVTTMKGFVPVMHVLILMDKAHEKD